MTRGLMFIFIVWMLVTILFQVYGHLNRNERLTLARCLIYGMVTAVVAGGVVSTIVVLF